MGRLNKNVEDVAQYLLWQSGYPAGGNTAGGGAVDRREQLVLCGHVSAGVLEPSERAPLPHAPSLDMIADETRMSISVTRMFLRHYLRYILRSAMAKQLVITDGIRDNRVRGAGPIAT